MVIRGKGAQPTDACPWVQARGMGAAVRCLRRLLAGCSSVSVVDQPGELVAQPGGRCDRRAAAAAARCDRAISQPGHRPAQAGGAGPQGTGGDHPRPGRRPRPCRISCRGGAGGGSVVALSVAGAVRPGHHGAATAGCAEWTGCRRLRHPSPARPCPPPRRHPCRRPRRLRRRAAQWRAHRWRPPPPPRRRLRWRLPRLPGGDAAVRVAGSRRRLRPQRLRHRPAPYRCLRRACPNGLRRRLPPHQRRRLPGTSAAGDGFCRVQRHDAAPNPVTAHACTQSERAARSTGRCGAAAGRLRAAAAHPTTPPAPPRLSGPGAAP